MDNKKMVINQFGSNARNYVISQIHAKGKDLDFIREVVKGGKDKVLLDVATGGGHVANALAPFVKTVTALDLTPKMLAQAKEFIESNGHDNVVFVQGDAEDLPFGDKSYDVVTCRVAPHHFPNVKRFIGESFRVLTDGGMFILVDNVSPELDDFDQFYNEVEKKRDPSHYRAYKKSEWISWIEEKGFSIQTFLTFKKRFVFDEWCKTMNLSSEAKEELNNYMIASPREVINFFSIEMENNQIHSFQGEAMILIALKTINA
ncbi:class I SAM-dependent methyltransferase [Siminovitchia fortis]|uniref:Class I SAM-dependent methyltransferase n=1 Tax=Siminovitchia fortis TaxID=254758 RepID=A0A443IRM4_9BACI|nr:class I SAM-dependent methyltransferase [Siminovitchia fortis]RWR09292.1 class I SAM-dependent methyltransferase [Siminovitchia fortis]WHY80905.1 class I SAM-dependent methyltransferase [Siminovitchia fortis]